MGDLTERNRLVLKLDDAGIKPAHSFWVVNHAPTILPLLLAELELVAGLDIKVKVATLKALIEQLHAQAGYRYVNVDGHLALVCPDPIREGVSADDLRLSALTPHERAALKVGQASLKIESARRAWEAVGRKVEDSPQAFAWSDAVDEHKAALSEASAITPRADNASR